MKYQITYDVSNTCMVLRYSAEAKSLKDAYSLVLDHLKKYNLRVTISEISQDKTWILHAENDRHKFVLIGYQPAMITGVHASKIHKV